MFYYAKPKLNLGFANIHRARYSTSMLQRKIQSFVSRMAKEYPVLLITGPRQSGKTTLAQHLFAIQPNTKPKPYVNLESLAEREFAETDPIGFLNRFPQGAILDEVQRVPQLISEIQVRVDQTKTNGMFILTGSHQAALHQATAQSLAGRVALIKLLPLSLEEYCPEEIAWTEMVFNGFYPRVITQKLDPVQAYGNYVETYIEKDLRQMVQIRDLSLFQKFLKLCAGRVGQLLNFDQLANDTGTSATTIRHWISVLEASYVITLLNPLHRNISKRLTKSPKLYFHDVGIASYLLGIENYKQVENHPLRGQLFENLVISDLIKARYNRGHRDHISFYRDSTGNEVDAVIEVAGQTLPIEIKSSQTFDTAFLKGLKAFSKIEPKRPKGDMVVYAGKDYQRRTGYQIIPFTQLPSFYSEMREFFSD